VPREVRTRQLLALAEELFAERGYDRASMDELARRAGISKPVIYGLVRSKEDLHRRCFERAADDLADAVARAAAAHVGDLRAMMQAGSLAFFEFIDGHRDPWAMLFEENAGAHHLRHIARIRDRQARLVVGMLIERAAEGGRAIDRRELEAAAHALNGAAEALAHWWRENPEVPAKTLADWLVAVMLPGLERLTGAPGPVTSPERG
jgi:AcrR family transcriptional regulator